MRSPLGGGRERRSAPMGDVWRNRLTGLTLAGTIATLLTGTAQAQTLPLPVIDVISSRFGTGITGASTSVITAEDIARSPAQTIPELLSQQPGIQVRNRFGSVNAAQTTVDIRGFGATATSNTLVLVNGRRLNDID